MPPADPAPWLDLPDLDGPALTGDEMAEVLRGMGGHRLDVHGGSSGVRERAEPGETP
ncbi:hypothetical protein [Streptomyces sp. A1499]|uniref:hypothetical protein n=1 Tax=Streptomyces sp. A1499 TaxID=2563104 RepID=UPI00144AA769|nr:hypothetical protein [Streptomyces sp. A1499]